jgi:hypothetical protein
MTAAQFTIYSLISYQSTDKNNTAFDVFKDVQERFHLEKSRAER